MNSRKQATASSLQFDDVKRRLRPGDVFQRSDHDWKTQSNRRWKGTCPWHDSDSGTCFSVNPETLEWKCFSCDRGGGPLQYVAELEGVGSGARGSLDGKDFFRAWDALSRHAGCEGPPELSTEEDSGRKSSDRRPRRSPRKNRDRTRSRPQATAPRAAGSGENMSRDIPPQSDSSGQPSEPKLDTPESELRSALVAYRDALQESDRARAYVEGRGLSVETLRAYGCGFAPAGEWPQDDSPKHRWKNGRIVTPLTTPEGRLVNLHARAVGTCPRKKRHRYWPGNPTPPAAYFNAPAIKDESFDSGEPLVICEGPMDALSFIVEGWERAVAIYNTDGVPWRALRDNADTLVFAFDHDEDSETGQTDAAERAGEAYWRGFDAHTLHDEDSYAGQGDPNDALQAGELTTGYLEALNGVIEDGAAEGAVAAADGNGPEAGQSPTSREMDREATGEKPQKQSATAADLIPYWNGDDIGHLGRWLWERGGVPDGDVGAGLYADRELHVWIKEKLEAGPRGTSKQTKIRLRWVLWRLYAAHGPEEVPEGQIPIPPMRRA